MRVLYLSRADEFRDKSSLVIIAKSVFRHMLEADPQMYVTWVVPRGTSDDVLHEYVLAPLGENARRMGFVKCMAGVAGRTLGYFLTEDVWYALTQTKVDVPYDVVLTPSVIRKVTAQSEVIANGVDWPRLFEVYQQRKVRQQAWRDSDRLGMDARLFWGGRLANQKKPRVTFPLMAEVQRVTGVDVVVSTNRPESDPDVAWCHETFPRWTLYTGVDRTAFFGLMAQGDVFMCDSPSESYGVAWWNDTLLPEWYPFRHEDPEVRVQMAAALIEQWPDGELWTKYVPLVREWIEHEHNEQRCGVALASTLHVQKVGSLDRDRGKGSGSVGQLAHAAALGIWQSNEQPIPEQQVYARMTELSDTHREWGKPGDLVSRMYLRRCLEAAGWIDLCRSREVEYVLQA
jgi:hypothetical protein